MDYAGKIVMIGDDCNIERFCHSQDKESANTVIDKIKERCDLAETHKRSSITLSRHDVSILMSKLADQNSNMKIWKSNNDRLVSENKVLRQALDMSVKLMQDSKVPVTSESFIEASCKKLGMNKIATE
jgi:hypothetical protein